MEFLTLGSLLLAAANWVTVVASRLLHRGSHVERYVGSVSALDQAGSMLFSYPADEDSRNAIRAPEGRVVAYSQVCTHLSCAVVYDKAENGLFCPCHHSLFNLAGQPIAGPHAAFATGASGTERRSTICRRHGGPISLHRQGTTLFSAMLAFVGVAVVLQLWLLTVSMEGLLMSPESGPLCVALSRKRNRRPRRKGFLQNKKTLGTPRGRRALLVRGPTSIPW